MFGKLTIMNSLRHIDAEKPKLHVEWLARKNRKDIAILAHDVLGRRHRVNEIKVTCTKREAIRAFISVNLIPNRQTQAYEQFLRQNDRRRIANFRDLELYGHTVVITGYAPPVDSTAIVATRASCSVLSNGKRA